MKFLIMLCRLYSNPLCAKISGIIFQTFPISIVKRLELGSDIEKVVGGVLHYVVDKSCIRREMSLGKVIRTTRSVLYYGGAGPRERVAA